MTALVVTETVVLAILALLVIGLLRTYAAVLNRLHALETGQGVEPFRTLDGVPGPSTPGTSTRVEGRDEWAAAHDLGGLGIDGAVVSIRTVGVPHDTVLIFLSSGCTGCTAFWSDLARDWPVLSGVRVLVVAKSPAEESPAALARLCPPGVDLVLSSAAWSDYAVPGSPYVVLVNGRTGRVAGEGSGTSLGQVLDLVTRTEADRRSPDAAPDEESAIDRALWEAGIGPGDPRLYGAPTP